MDERCNLFLGSMDKVLLAMSEHLPVHVVVSPRGRLRNMRLEKRLRDGGTQWLEYQGRDDFLNVISGIGPRAICAVGGFSWRLDQSFIAASDYIVNFHPGDLLCCRGPQPIEAALYHRHPSLAVCAHRIDSEAMDAGPILDQEAMPVDTARGYSWHKSAMDQLTYRVAERLMRELADGQRPAGETWDVAASTWYERLSKEELKTLYTTPTLADYYNHRSLN